jgi:hypothetical protein
LHEPADAGVAGIRHDLPMIWGRAPRDERDGATMSKKTEHVRLTIKRETLRTLTPTELRLVAGGGCRRTTLCN